MEVATPKDATSPPTPSNPDMKILIENVVKNLLEEMGFGAEREHGAEWEQSGRSMSSKVQNSIRDAVRLLKRVDPDGAEERLGTIIFVKSDLAITCFHEVCRKGHILQDSLRVDGKALLHHASFPYYDLSLYSCADRDGGFLKLGSFNRIGLGGQIYLASYPSITEFEDDDSNFVLCPGSISDVEDEDNVVLGQYQCFPGSSGGAVVSSSGLLVGMHLESVFHQDESILQPPDWYNNCNPWEVVRSLYWEKGDEPSPENLFENAASKDLALFAARNVSSKGHLGRFQSVNIIRTKLLEEGLLPIRPQKKLRKN